MSVDQGDTSLDNDIAVVGMAGRFPGARNVDDFWSNIRDGRECITDLSDDQLRRAGVPEDLLANPKYVKCAPVLEGVEGFDAQFFGISPRDAAIMDPQHRHFLECAWEALEDAGHPPERFEGNVAVFAGSGAQAYVNRNVMTHSALVDSVGSFLVHYTGNEKDVLATRASYQFNLTGPSITVQTACSTSLVAIHLACRSLLYEECDMALAGGVTICVPHGTGYLYREGEIRSRDGHCRPFDAAADGTTFGSGVGVVVLRRLSDALMDRDRIYGVIKGSAVNNDGSQKVGYFAPSVSGQALAIAEALAASGVDAESIGYVETHGTGTRIGDPIEIEALTEAYRAYTDKKGYCAIGSLKANIGHLDAASGVAGFIKTVQALAHQQLPPSINFESPNPAIDFAGSPFHVDTDLRPWRESDQPRRAAVNSLGIGGTNAHVILEEAPPQAPGSRSRDWQVLMLSARNRSALEKATDALASHIEQHPELDLADVAHTLQVGRHAFGERRIAVCRDRQDAVVTLAGRDRLRVETQTCSGADRRIVFMFTGQGSQYVNMGRELYGAESHFREQVDHCADILTPHMGCDVRDLLYPDPERADVAAKSLQDTAVAQPVLFTIEFALASLWRRWGVEPDAMIGHSLGEYVSACLSGVLSLDDALALVALRGRLMQEMPPGSMLAVLRPEDEVRGELSDSVSIAAVNALEVCVVSGPSDEIDALRTRLEERGALCRPLHVTHAFHSPMMEPILSRFTEEVRKVRLSPPRIPFVSNVSGDWITDAQAVDPAYWGKEHIRKPVRFADGLQRLTQGKETVLLEVGPGAALTGLARQSADRSTVHTFAASLPNAKEEISEVQFLLTSLGRIWQAGAPIDWNGFYADESRNRVSLPTYPFEPVRHWLEPETAGEERPGSAPDTKPEFDDWFYQPSWRRSLRPRLEQAPDVDHRLSTVAVFADVCGIGDGIASRLRQRGHRVIVVRPGGGFAENGEDEIVIAPGSKSDMDRVVERFFRAESAPSCVVHTWNVTPDDANPATDAASAEAEDLAFFSLLHLAQAFARKDRSEPVHLTVVSNGMQQVAGEPVPHPTKALLLGPCKVIPREISGFGCRSVDVSLPEPGTWQWDELIESLAAEALYPGDDDVVAYRGSERLVETFDRVPFQGEGTHASPLREGGTYLITGGLGGLGLVVAEHLIRHASANVVLIGRTQLPAAEGWDEWLATHDPNDPTSVRIRKMRSLEKSGGSIRALEADVADPRQIREVVNQAQREFGTLHGVFHLAGVLDDGLLELKTKDAIERVFRPKVQGTRALLAALDGIPLDFLALFSSLSSVVGLAGQIDYAAANSFLNAIARQKRAQDGSRIVAIDWGMWEEVGMAAERLQPIEEPTRFGGGGTETQINEIGTRTHWVINEHRRKDGVAVMPGTGYLGLARAAFAGGNEWVPFEMRDIFFLAPMAFHGEERRNLRLQLGRDREKMRFTFSSRLTTASEENGDWGVHSTGVMAPLGSGEPRPCDLGAILKRCTDRAELSSMNPEHDFWAFGPRWASLKEMRFGQQEAVLVLEMPSEFEAELSEFPLHPALFDMATGELVTQFSDSDALFVPFSYGAIRGYKPLEPLLYCHVRYRQPSLEGATVAAYDVTIANERGEVLVEVEKFLMRRVAGEGVDFGEQRSQEPDTPAVAKRRLAQGQGGSSSLYRYGIRPGQGLEALERILTQSTMAQVVVSPVDLETLRAANRAEARSKEGGAPELLGTAGVAAAIEHSQASPADTTSIIVSLWQEALGIEDVRENDNFFDLGGHSLSLVQIADQMRQRFGLELPLSDLIEHITVDGWTRTVNSALAAAGSSKAD